MPGIVILLLGLLAACGSDERSASLLKGLPRGTASIDATSTVAFTPRHVGADWSICTNDPPPHQAGAMIDLTTADPRIRPDLAGASSTLFISYTGAAPVRDQRYEMAQPQPKKDQIGTNFLEKQFGAMKLTLNFVTSTTASACLSGCSGVIDPNAPVKASVVFTKAGLTEGSAIELEFDVTLYSGKRLKGSLSTALVVTESECATAE